MGRSFLYDANVESQIAALYGKSTWSAGLVIGQLTSQKDYVVHIAATPSQDDEHDTATGSLANLDEQWVATHATQVLRMLPAGLDVIGIFAMGSPNMMKDAQVKLRQTLFAVHKQLSKTEILPRADEDISDRLLLQICSVTRKYTCRTFDITDPKSAARPADWKQQSFVNKWSTLTTSLSMDLVIPISTAALSHMLNKQIETGLLPFCNSIWNAMTLFNHQLLPEDTLLDTSQQTTKKAKGKHSAPTGPDGLTFSAQLYAQQSSGTSGSEPLTRECGARMLVRGTIRGHAVVHNKATVKDATQALKRDLVRSLVSRCSLMCEEIEQTEEDQDPKVLYEMPRRVLASTGSSPLKFCDYVFPDEQQADSEDRFRELLGLDLENIDIDMEYEKLPEESDLIKPERLPKPKESNISSTTNLRSMLGIVLSGAMGALAVGLSYMYLGYE